MNLNKKSMSTGVILAIFFGPIGLLYSSVIGGVILILISFISAATIIVPILCWLVSILLAIQGVSTHNNNVDLILKTLNTRNQDNRKEFNKLFLFINDGAYKSIVLMKEAKDLYEFDIVEGSLEKEIPSFSTDMNVDDILGTLKSKFKKVRSFQTIDLAEEYYDKEIKES